MPPGKPGRPRVPVPGWSVSLYLRSPEVDLLARIARRRDVSMSGLFRQMVRRELCKDATEKIVEKP